MHLPGGNLLVPCSSSYRGRTFNAALQRSGGPGSRRGCLTPHLPAQRPTSSRPTVCFHALNTNSPAPSQLRRTPLDSNCKPSAARGSLQAAQDASAFGFASTTECVERDCYAEDQQEERFAGSSSSSYSVAPETWDFIQSQTALPICQLSLHLPRQETSLTLADFPSFSSTGPKPAAGTDHHHPFLQAPQHSPSPIFPPLPSLSTPSTPSASNPAPISLVAWGALLLLSLSYMHHACNSFSLPVMFPAVSADLGLDDLQGALLTTGYSYLYALALLPVGLLCDRLPRPKLLAAGVASWSALTLLASGAQNFTELLVARVGFAAAQAVQNPISFAILPELFPNNKSMAVSIYNCSMYLGRALSYRAALAGEELSRLRKGFTAIAAAASGAVAGSAASLDPAEGAASLAFVPLDKLDLGPVSSTGDFAAVMPHLGTTMGSALEDLQLMHPASSDAVSAVVTAAGDTGWREVLRWVAAPGFLLALALVLALPEPRDKAAARGTANAAALQAAQAKDQQQQGRQAGSTAANFLTLLRSPAFMFTTLAASFNDVANYALMAWQSTFYERVYHLQPEQYAPMLAAVLPIGGIIGGVGGGWLADRAAGARNGSRVWVTAGTGALAAPVILLSMLAGSADESFLALMVGFSLSEAWRAPGANMARSLAPPEMGSSASALYLCIRNLVGGMGPIGVTLLTHHLGGDLQRGMLLVPAMYLASGAMFFVAEQQFAQQEGAGDPPAGAGVRNSSKAPVI